MNKILNHLFLRHPSGLYAFTKTLTNVYYEQFHDNYLNEKEAVFLMIKSAVENVENILNEQEVEYLSNKGDDCIPIMIMCIYIKKIETTDDVEYYDTCVIEFENLYEVVSLIFNETCPDEFKIDTSMSIDMKNLYFNFWNVND